MKKSITESMIYGNLLNAINEYDKILPGPKDDEDNVRIEIVKKAEKKIKSSINKGLKDFWKAEKNNYQEKENYDWRKGIKTCPSADYIDYDSCNMPQLQLKYDKGSIRSNDDVLFFEEDFVKWFKKSNNELNKFFFIWVEDYPGIFINPKKKLQEAVLLSEAKNSNYKVGDKITVEFKDKKFKAEITSNYKGEDINTFLSKIDSCISTFNGITLWNYLANHFRKGLENCDYWEDNKLTGKSLKDAIISIDYIHIDKFGDVVIVGDSKDDEEHGYEVVFPKGKFLKSPKEEYSKDIDEPGYQPKYTLLTDGYYFQH